MKMDDTVGGLAVGVSVDISRTDGRVHSATVSAVNPTSRSVTVEWFEKGETKGKEIEFDAIFSLNPDLQPQDRKLMPPPAKYAILSTQEPDDESSLSEAELSDYNNSKKKPKGRPLRGSGRFLRSTQINIPASIYRNSAVLSSSNLQRPLAIGHNTPVLRSQSTSRICMVGLNSMAAEYPGLIDACSMILSLFISS